MYRDDFKARYTTIPFAIYREYCEYRSRTVIAHSHREIELISICKGRADFYIDTIHYEAKKGDVVVIPPYSIHRISLPEDELVVYDCICFDLELIWDNEIKNGLTSGTLFVGNIVDAALPYTQKIQEMIGEACDTYEKSLPGWELQVIGNMSMLVGCLKEHGYFTSELKSKSENNFAQRVMSYISDNYSSPITSSTVAASLYMNNSYFCRTFKKAFGCRFSDYLQAYRLEKSRMSLTNTSDPITDIAFQTGFSCCSYFSKVFREHFGISPFAYRKKHSDNT